MAEARSRTIRAKRRTGETEGMLQATTVEGVSLDPALTGAVGLVLAVALTVAWLLAFYR
jgi:hypothetical protein